MAFRLKGAPTAPAAPKRVPQIPQTSEVGKMPSAMPAVGGAPKPMRSRRDYGKTTPAPGSAPQPSPFGPLGG